MWLLILSAALSVPGADRSAHDDATGARITRSAPGAAPVVASVTIHGATRTRASVVSSLVDLAPGVRLTPGRLARARRRLAELPAATATIATTPLANGQVAVDVMLDEGSALPSGLFGLSAFVGRAVIQDDLQVPVNNLAGVGETITTAFRWPYQWRRFLVDAAAPSPAGLPGLADASGSWERQVYRAPGVPGADAMQSDHTEIAAGLDDWIADRARWQASASFDRWNGVWYPGGAAGLDVRAGGDRLSFGGTGSAWVGRAGGRGFGQLDAWSAWRSSAGETRALWTALVEVTTATIAAPIDLWSGAGTGPGRPALLRAHALLQDNVIDGPVFGRTLAHATIEYQHLVRTIYGTPLRAAGFVDVAQAWHRIDGTVSPRFVDAGIGLRWTARGLGGVIRLDLAHPVGAGGGFVGSAGWEAAWPHQ